MGYFSNQASIEARISALRLAGFIDRDADGDPDPLALLAGQHAARGLVRGYLARDYDHDTIDAWDIDAVGGSTVPELIGTISDDLCIGIFYAGNPRFADMAQKISAAAEAKLLKIRDGLLDIYEVDRVTSHIATAIATGRTPSDFDPERDYDDLTARPSWVYPADTRELEGY